MEESSNHITNINRSLQNIKLDVKVVFSLNLQTIEKYVKNANHIIADSVEVSHLPQSKLYLKIIDIPYLKENTNTLITADMVEDILKKNYIFNNISLVSRP